MEQITLSVGTILTIVGILLGIAGGVILLYSRVARLEANEAIRLRTDEQFHSDVKDLTQSVKDLTVSVAIINERTNKLHN